MQDILKRSGKEIVKVGDLTQIRKKFICKNLLIFYGILNLSQENVMMMNSLSSYQRSR